MPADLPSETQPPVWNDALLANPHAAADKRQRVQRMFAAIAPSYDINNRLHSLWMDQRWRRKAVKLAAVKPTDVVVDVACGTGDLALAFAYQLQNLNRPERLPPGRVIGIDFTFEMLPIARQKASKCHWTDCDIVWHETRKQIPESSELMDVYFDPEYM